jgi:predicted dehydrogenase
MIPNVGVALVGAGPWGLTLGRAAARLPNVDLRWVCDLKEERRQGAAALHPAARLTGALDEALEDPGVNAVLVAVESPQHHAVGRRVLEANRHVLIEKPMAITSADAAELTALAASRQRVLSVGHLLLHHPAVRRVRQLVEQGALGELLWLESTRLTTGPARSSSGAWWALAPHDVSLALHFFGTIPSRVSAVAHGARGEVDTVTWATLHFPDGGLAHIHVARRSPEGSSWWGRGVFSGSTSWRAQESCACTIRDPAIASSSSSPSSRRIRSPRSAVISWTVSSGATSAVETRCTR